MELLDLPIQLSRLGEPVWVHLLTDLHRASLGCDSKQWRSDINQIKHAVEKKGEKHYWLGGGDLLNAIGPKDRRHDTAAIAPEFRDHIGDDLFQAEASAIVSELRSIRDYGIGIGMGNHEATIARQGEFNPSRYIAEHLNLPYLGYSALIRFRLMHGGNSQSVICFWHHGYGAARTKGGKLNMLWGLRDVVEADVYCTGHVHELIDFPESRLSGTRRGAFRLHQQEILFVNGGTYQKAYATGAKSQKAFKFDPDHFVRPDYAEVKAFRSAVIGHNGWRMQKAHSGNKDRNRSEPQWSVRLKRVDFRR